MVLQTVTTNNDYENDNSREEVNDAYNREIEEMNINEGNE